MVFEAFRYPSNDDIDQISSFGVGGAFQSVSGIRNSLLEHEMAAVRATFILPKLGNSEESAQIFSLRSS